MKTHVLGHDIALPDALRDYVGRRAGLILGRFGSRVRRVLVRFVDVNGPREGNDKRCRVETRLAGRDPVVVEEASSDLRRAVDGALARAERAVRRVISRSPDSSRRGSIRRANRTSGALEF